MLPPDDLAVKCEFSQTYCGIEPPTLDAPTGFEPATYGLEDRCSSSELRGVTCIIPKYFVLVKYYTLVVQV